MNTKDFLRYKFYLLNDDRYRKIKQSILVSDIDKAIERFIAIHSKTKKYVNSKGRMIIKESTRSKGIEKITAVYLINLSRAECLKRNKFHFYLLRQEHSHLIQEMPFDFDDLSLNKMHESLPATAEKLANSSKNNVN